MAQPAASALTEVTTMAGTAHANPLYPADAPLIRLSGSGRPDPLIAAITRHITESGSVFFELPGGRLTIVLYLDGKTWIARRCDEGTPAASGSPAGCPTRAVTAGTCHLSRCMQIE